MTVRRSRCAIGATRQSFSTSSGCPGRKSWPRNAEVKKGALEAAVEFGPGGVVELTGVIGYYTMVAMTLNAHEIPLPDGATPPLAP